MPTEPNTHRKLVVPRIQTAGWDDEPLPIAKRCVVSAQAFAARYGQSEADPSDLLCHLAFDAPLPSRRQHADRVKKNRTAFFNYLASEPRDILDAQLEKYADDGELRSLLYAA